MVRLFLLLVGSLALTLCGVFLAVRGKGRPAFAVTLFFGCCAAVQAATIARRLRQRRDTAISVRVVGGVAIRPSRGRLAAWGVLTLSAGVGLAILGESFPFPFRAASWAIAASGALVLAGVAARRLPVGFLQFDPAGLSLGRRHWTITLPWDQVERVAAGEVNDNAAALLWVRDLAAVAVTPPEKQRQAVRAMLSSVEWTGAPVVVLTGAYGLSLPHLVAALERYASEPAARAELAPRPGLPGGVDAGA